MQYKVPQNVDIEDRVIGPLTVRQFIILLVAIGIILILNFILIGPLRLIFYLVALVIGGLAVIIAFVKYGNQNFEIFLFSAFKTFITPRKRVWKKEKAKVEKEKIVKPEPPKPEPKKKKNIDEAKDDLSRLAEVVDSGGFSKVGGPERQTNIDLPPTVDNSGATDFLVSAENPNEKIDSLMEKASKATPKRDQLVSEAASVDPKKPQETPKIKLRGDGFE